MERNFKLIFNGPLSIFIGIIISILIILNLKLTFNLKLSMLNLIKFDLSLFLMVISLIFTLNKISQLDYCLTITV